jgi:hypothetical protein
MSTEGAEGANMSFWDKYGKPVQVSAALIVVATAAIAAIIKYVPPFPRLAEERMVSKLVPGNDYTKLRDIIGTNPDRTVRFAGTKQTYKIFNRKWEYLALLIDPSNSVMSVGVWATDPFFKVTVGYAQITVNGPTMSQLSQQHGQPIGAWGTCSASFGEYFEGYKGYAAINYQWNVAGAWSLEDSNANYCEMFLVPRG